MEKRGIITNDTPVEEPRGSKAEKNAAHQLNTDKKTKPTDNHDDHITKRAADKVKEVLSKNS